MEGNAPHGNRYVQFSSDQPGQIAHMLQGFAIDGRNVKKLRISLDAWLHQFEPGSEPHQKPGLVIHYYDERRKPLASNRVGDWTVGNQWERLDHTVNVPSEAREAIVQIGLNGATGKVSVDDVAVTPVN